MEALTRHCFADLSRWQTMLRTLAKMGLRDAERSLLVGPEYPTVAADILGHDPAIYLRTYAHLYPEDRAPAAVALDAARPTTPTAHDPAAPLGTTRTCSARGESAGTRPRGAK